MLVSSLAARARAFNRGHKMRIVGAGKNVSRRVPRCSHTVRAAVRVARAHPQPPNPPIQPRTGAFRIARSHDTTHNHRGTRVSLADRPGVHCLRAYRDRVRADDYLCTAGGRAKL